MKRFVLAALAATALPLGAAQAQEVTLRVHSFLPPVANPMKHFVIPWAEKIEKDSNGRIKVQVFPSMQLGGKPAQLLHAGARRRRRRRLDAAGLHAGRDRQAGDLRAAVPASEHQRDGAFASGICAEAPEKGSSSRITCCWCTATPARCS